MFVIDKASQYEQLLAYLSLLTRGYHGISKVLSELWKEVLTQIWTTHVDRLVNAEVHVCSLFYACVRACVPELYTSANAVENNLSCYNFGPCAKMHAIGFFQNVSSK